MHQPPSGKDWKIACQMWFIHDDFLPALKATRLSESTTWRSSLRNYASHAMGNKLRFN